MHPQLRKWGGRPGRPPSLLSGSSRVPGSWPSTPIPALGAQTPGLPSFKVWGRRGGPFSGSAVTAPQGPQLGLSERGLGYDGGVGGTGAHADPWPRGRAWHVCPAESRGRCPENRSRPLGARRAQSGHAAPRGQGQAGVPPNPSPTPHTAATARAPRPPVGSRRVRASRPCRSWCPGGGVPQGLGDGNGLAAAAVAVTRPTADRDSEGGPGQGSRPSVWHGLACITEGLSGCLLSVVCRRGSGLGCRPGLRSGVRSPQPTWRAWLGKWARRRPRGQSRTHGLAEAQAAGRPAPDGPGPASGRPQPQHQAGRGWQSPAGCWPTVVRTGRQRGSRVRAPSWRGAGGLGP